MSRPWQLILYRNAMRLATPAAGFVLRARLKKGKEDAARLGERKGIPGVERPQGPLIWIHGASVGETIAMTPIVERLLGRGYHVLVTSGTVTSAKVMAQRLPQAAIHQYIPLDAPGFMRRFLSYWRPEIGLIAESELWPNMLIEARKHDIPLMLLNGRMSDRSFERWSRQRNVAEALLSRFDIVMAQSRLDSERYMQLGAPRVILGGNLKYDVQPPPADPAQLALLEGVTAGRPIWIAASTHRGEDEAVAAAHRQAAERFPTLLTIAAPRHPARGEEVEQTARAFGITAARRSAGLGPDRAVDLYVADTVGELGLFYRMANIAFIGGSLIPHGGQNPIEAAKLGSAIIHGPEIGNFRDVYEALNIAKGASVIHDSAELGALVTAWLADPARPRDTGRRAKAVVDELAGAADRIMMAVDPLLARASLLGGRQR
jgi:3-deoxy-D-manno-octulosonic-acid transferase